MDSVAALGFSVDSTPLARTADEMERLRQASRGLGQQTEQLNRAQANTIRHYETLIGRTAAAGRELAQFNALRRAGTSGDTAAGRAIAELAGVHYDLVAAQKARKTATDNELRSMQQAMVQRAALIRTAEQENRQRDREMDAIRRVATEENRARDARRASMIAAAEAENRARDQERARIRQVTDNLQFEMAQRSRSARERVAFAAAQQAGIAANSAEARSVMDLARANFDAQQAHERRNRIMSSGTALILRQAAAVGALIAASYTLSQIRTQVDQVGAIGDVAERLKVSTELVQVFRLQMQLAGGTIGEADAALDRFNRQVGMAVTGQGYLAKLFKANSQTISKDLNEAYVQTLRLISNIQDSTQRASVTQQIFGRGSRELVAVLEGGPKALLELYEEMRSKQQILSAETVKEGQRIDDAWTKLTDRMDKNFKKSIIESILFIERWGTQFTRDIDAVAGDGAWVKIVNHLISVAAAMSPITRQWAIIRGLTSLGPQGMTAPDGGGGGWGGEGEMPKSGGESARGATAFAAMIAKGGLDAGARPTNVPKPNERANDYEKLVKSMTKANVQMAAEIAMQGQGVFAIEAYKKEQEALLAVEEAKIQLTPRIRQQIAELSQEYGALKEGIERAKVMSDAIFERNSLFIPDGEVKIAKELRKIYGDDIPAALRSTEAAVLRMNEAWKMTRDLTTEAVSGIARDTWQMFREGPATAANFFSALERSAIKALDNITAKLIEMAAQQLWQKAFGAAAGSIGAGIGNMAGFGSWAGSGFNGSGLPLAPSAMGNVFAGGNIIRHALGGIVSRPHVFRMANGGLASVAENEPEAVMPLKRMPSGRMGVETSGGGGTTVQIIDQAGVQKRTQTTRQPDGSELVRVVLTETKRDMGTGGYDKAMGRFGTPRLNRR